MNPLRPAPPSFAHDSTPSSSSDNSSIHDRHRRLLDQPLRAHAHDEQHHGNNGPKKYGEKPFVQHDDVDRLHGRDPLRWRNARQSFHNEIRKSEEDSGHKTGPECCDERQEVDRISTSGRSHHGDEIAWHKETSSSSREATLVLRLTHLFWPPFACRIGSARLWSESVHI